MTRAGRNLLAVAARTRVRDLITQPPYAFVISSSDMAELSGRAPEPIHQPVKPTPPVR